MTLNVASLYYLKLSYLLRGIKRITEGNCVIRSQLLRASTMPAAISHMAVIYKRCQNLWVTVGEKSNTWERSLFFPLLWYEGGKKSFLPQHHTDRHAGWAFLCCSWVRISTCGYHMSDVESPKWKLKQTIETDKTETKGNEDVFWDEQIQIETTAEGWAASIMTLVRLCRGNFIIQDYWRWFLIVDLIIAASVLLHIPPAFSWC